MALVLITIKNSINQQIELLIQDHSVDNFISLIEEGKNKLIGKSFTHNLFFRVIEKNQCHFDEPTYVFDRVGKYEGEWLAWYSQLYQMSYSIKSKKLSELQAIFQDIKVVELTV